MSAISPDHNLLFGLLALQNGFISPEQLVTAFRRWTVDKSQLLDQILLLEGALDEPTQELLLALTAAHLAQHGNDPQQSLHRTLSHSPIFTLE